MLRADFMPRPYDATLQQRECVLDGIGMNIPINVNLVPMTNRLVLGTFDASGNHGLRVGWQFICDHNLNVSANAFLNVPRQCSGLRIFGMKESQFATALTDANHDFFVIVGLVPSPAPMLPTADIGFVHFDGTIQHRAVCFFHSGTNPMAEIPSGFVTHSQSTLDLVGTHSLSGFTEKEHCHEPRFERQVSIVEYGLS